MVACISYTADAYGDDDKKENKKKGQIKVENKEPKKLRLNEGDDTLVFDKMRDDTLTFDDEKTKDDTLIFADDEMKQKGNPNREKKTEEFSITKSNSDLQALNALIYPNPSFGQSVVELNTSENSISEIIITSQDGTLIKKINVTGDSYELNGLATGNYIITIINGNQTVQKRLLVK